MDQTNDTQANETDTKNEDRIGGVLPKVPSDEANAKMNARTLGRVAFEAYGAKTGGVTYDGARIPPWTALPDQIKEAWESAARAVQARCGNCPKSAEEAQ